MFASVKEPRCQNPWYYDKDYHAAHQFLLRQPPLLPLPPRAPLLEIATLGDVVNLTPGDRRIHVEWILQASAYVDSLSAEEDEDDDDADIDDAEDDTRTTLLSIEKGDPWRRVIRSGVPLSVPLCSIHCTDPLLLLRTFEFWNVAWSKAPRCMLELFFHPTDPRAHITRSRLSVLTAHTHYPLLDLQIRRLAAVRRMWDAHFTSANRYVLEAFNENRAAATALCRVLSIVEMDAALCHSAASGRRAMKEEENGTTSAPVPSCRRRQHDPELLHVLLEMLVKTHPVLADPTEFEDALLLVLQEDGIRGDIVVAVDGCDGAFISRPSQCISLVFWCRERLERMFQRTETIEPPPSHQNGDEVPSVIMEALERRQQHPEMVRQASLTESELRYWKTKVERMRCARRHLVYKCLAASDMESAEVCANGSFGVPSAYVDYRDGWTYFRRVGWMGNVTTSSRATVRTLLCPRAMVREEMARVPFDAVVLSPQMLQTRVDRAIEEHRRIAWTEVGAVFHRRYHERQYLVADMVDRTVTNLLAPSSWKWQRDRFDSSGGGDDNDWDDDDHQKRLHAALVYLLQTCASAENANDALLPDDFWMRTVKTRTVPAHSMFSIVQLNIPEVTSALVNLAVARKCTSTMLTQICLRLPYCNNNGDESGIRIVFDAFLAATKKITTEEDNDDLSVWWETLTTDDVVDAVCTMGGINTYRNEYLVSVSCALRLGCPFGPNAGWYTHPSNDVHDLQLRELNDWIRQVGGGAVDEDEDDEDEDQKCTMMMMMNEDGGADDE